MNQTEPTNRGVSKPINEIVANILRYQNPITQKNPFRVRPTISGQYGMTRPFVEPDLNIPESLKQPGFTVDYNWGRSDEDYLKEMVTEFGDNSFTTSPDVCEIADLIQDSQQLNNTHISWNLGNWRSYSEARTGFEILESLLQ